MEPAMIEQHLSEVRALEDVFWQIPDNHAITRILDDAVKMLKLITDAAAKQYVDPFDWGARWRPFFGSRALGHPPQV
jgi:hypothetical protein